MVATPPVWPTTATDRARQGHLHLKDYVYVLLRRRRILLEVFLGVVALATLRTLLIRPVYEGTAQILIDRDTPNVLNFRQVTEEKSGGGIDDYYQTQYKLLQSRSLARRVIEQLNLLVEPEYGGPRDERGIAKILAQPPGQSMEMEAAIDGFLKRLSVTPIRNSRLVTITVQSHRPDLAAQATNALANLYIQQSLDLRFQTSSEAGHWLITQIEQQRKRVEQLDTQLQEVKAREGLVNVEERRTLLEQRLKELGTALNERKTERLQKEALWRQMAAASDPEELPEVMRNPLIQAQQVELATLERQQSQLLERYFEQHPEVMKVNTQIAQTKARILAQGQHVIRAAENDYRAAAAQEASVAAALESAKQEALDLAKRAVNYDSQKREVDAARQLLDGLVSRAKETDVAAELKAINLRIVDLAAVPSSPVRPRKLRDIMSGVFLGALLAIGLGFFLEYLDDTVKTPDDVRTHLGAPLLGVVPQHTRQGSYLALTNLKLEDPFTEGYRVIRTALNYSWTERGPRVIVVTSTAPGEGKTLTAVNLALALAGLGTRTILIDADLRRPQTQDLVKGRKTPGLSDVLVGRAQASQAIQPKGPGLPLAYIPGGTQVPSPADLLSTEVMHGLVSQLKSSYDWIVIDTPPVGAVADPLILAPLADGVVVVVGAEMVPRKAVMLTLERVRGSGARVLGVVLNRAQIEKHSYYYRQYYGHYHGKYEGRGRPAADPKVPSTGEKRARA